MESGFSFASHSPAYQTLASSDCPDWHFQSCRSPDSKKRTDEVHAESTSRWLSPSGWMDGQCEGAVSSKSSRFIDVDQP